MYNGAWNGQSRKRGLELTIENVNPLQRKTTINNHYNGSFVEPWNERAQRGYGVEVIERFVREVAFVEHGGPPQTRSERLKAMRTLAYNDLTADRQTVAAVQAMEAILTEHAAGRPNCIVEIDHPAGGLVLFRPGDSKPHTLYAGKVN